MPTNRTTLTTTVKKLVGAPDKFSIESRIFHVICLISVFVALITIPFDFYIGIPELALIMTGIFTSGLAVYYISRYKRNLPLAVILFGLLSNMAFLVNYTQNSGFYGPNLTMFLLSLLLIIAVAPQRQYWLWIPLNVTTVVGLLILEYHYPEIAPNTYQSEAGRYIDLGFSYIIIGGLIVLAIIYIRHSFHQQETALLKKAEELKLANETKNKLFSIVAHDLRSPLGSIQNYLELLNEHELTAEEKNLMEQELLIKTKDTGQMLFNILNWSMNQMGGVKAHMEALDLEEALRPVLGLHNTLAGEKGIELRNEIGKSAPVYGDLNLLQLVVRNIVSNAIKFTPSGGLITVSVSQTGNKSRIIVSDSGIGINDHQKENLFSLNIQPTYGTGNEKGLGLGLVLCREFISIQGGDILFESEAGKGTTVYITLNNASIDLPT